MWSKNIGKSIIIVSLFLMTICLTSCAESSELDACLTGDANGFWMGLIQGFICPFSFIVSIFDDEIAIYAVNNSGVWYDFGYLLGLASIFGGGTKGASKKK